MPTYRNINFLEHEFSQAITALANTQMVNPDNTVRVEVDNTIGYTIGDMLDVDVNDLNNATVQLILNDTVRYITALNDFRATAGPRQRDIINTFMDALTRAVANPTNSEAERYSRPFLQLLNGSSNALSGVERPLAHYSLRVLVETYNLLVADQTREVRYLISEGQRIRIGSTRFNANRTVRKHHLPVWAEAVTRWTIADGGTSAQAETLVTLRAEGIWSALRKMTTRYGWNGTLIIEDSTNLLTTVERSYRAFTNASLATLNGEITRRIVAMRDWGLLVSLDRLPRARSLSFVFEQVDTTGDTANAESTVTDEVVEATSRFGTGLSRFAEVRPSATLVSNNR
jgi:hypothetical protein